MTTTKYQQRQAEKEARRVAYEKKNKNKTKRVELETSLAGRPSGRPGDVVELLADEADAMIKRGTAREVKK